MARSNIRSVVLETKASFVCIQETKCLEWNERKLHSIGLGDYIGWVEVPPTWLSGGLISVWDLSVFSITHQVKARNWIWVQGECISSKIAFSCVNIMRPWFSKTKFNFRGICQAFYLQSMQSQRCY